MFIGKIKKNGVAILVFLINGLLVVLAACFIGSQERKDELVSQSEEIVKPIGPDLKEAQNKIASDREQKLRDLNTAPKTVEQKSTTTTTKETTTAPSASDRTTKTS